MKKSSITLHDISPLDVCLTLDCGQSFRWKSNGNAGMHGVVKGRAVDAEIKNGSLVISGDIRDGDELLWKEYFDLDRDYADICRKLSSDKWMKKSIEAFPGIRILKQDEWEALCSFIISQNNNIPRIKGIIDRLCGCFGEELGSGEFSFPSAEKIASLSVEELSPLRAGFRSKYIIDAARKIASGEVDIEKIKISDMDSARAELQKISGVGPKVAECTLLYGFGRTEAFPVDVWVRRIMSELYPEGLPACADSVQGIAQQYLFHWRRNIENPFEV